MNEVIQNILSRRSVKKYKSDMIPKEAIDEIIKAGTYAPNGRGMQSPIIVAVTNKAIRDELSRINGKIMGAPDGFDPFYNAPVVLIVLADSSCPTYIYDGSLVMENLMLSANSLGIGSCWIHRAKETFETKEGKAILNKLGIPETYQGIGNCILGYSDEPVKTASPRKDNYVYYLD